MRPTRKLEHEKYYHGIRSEDQIKDALKKSSVGDFCLRVTETPDGDYELIINVKGEGGIDSYGVKIVADQYCLRAEYRAIHELAPKFEFVGELVAYYKRHSLPMGGRLKRGICRPAWLLPSGCIEWTKKGLLGSGNFADVYKGTITGYDDEGKDIKFRAAIKVCKAERGEDRVKSLETRKSMMDEAKIMSQYKHPHVVRLFGVSADRPPVMIALELCPGGALIKHLESVPCREIPSTEKCTYGVEMALGMAYLHSQKCIHRDLAARNVLISTGGKLKIADFGLSKVLKKQSVIKDTINEIAIQWCAPETVNNKEQVFSQKTDVWSYGITLYEVCSGGKTPVEDDCKLLKKIRKLDLYPMPDSAPPLLKEVYKHIIVRDPDARPSFDDIAARLEGGLLSMPVLSAADFTLNRIPGVTRGVTEPSIEDSFSSKRSKEPVGVKRSKPRKGKAEPATSRPKTPGRGAQGGSRVAVSRMPNVKAKAKRPMSSNAYSAEKPSSMNPSAETCLPEEQASRERIPSRERCAESPLPRDRKHKKTASREGSRENVMEPSSSNSTPQRPKTPKKNKKDSTEFAEKKAKTPGKRR